VSYDTLLVLHVLSAFTLVAAETLLTVLVVSWRNLEVPSQIVRTIRLSLVARILTGVGLIGVIVFGIWLAIDIDGYEVWDGWILAALVLWLVFAEFDRRRTKAYAPALGLARTLAAGSNVASDELRALLRSREGLVLHVIAFALVLLTLLDMIYKPGA
jgi:uncharacterized membrane protein